jgi:acyl-CoA reductase-like NAD-dependent aldehyde dehydrogenase
VQSRFRRSTSGAKPEGTKAVSVYKVVNPATNETEREFPAATDAEIEQVLERSAQAYQS